MDDGYPQESVIVCEEYFNSDDAYELVMSNIDFLNLQFDEHLTQDEVSKQSLQSYYVDYFLAQVNNGGFSQFVYNSHWQEDTINYLCDGLEAIGAKGTLALLEEAALSMTELGTDRLLAFFQSDYLGENVERDILNQFDDRFFAIFEEEDLVELNAQWLRQLPNLVVLSDQEMKAEVQRRAEAIPDRDQRIAAALASEPRYLKLIRALCNATGHQFDCITAGDPTHEHKGEATMAWHFLTDKGHYYMVDADGKAFMFDGESDVVVSEIEASDEFGE